MVRMGLVFTVSPNSASMAVIVPSIGADERVYCPGQFCAFSSASLACRRLISSRPTYSAPSCAAASPLSSPSNVFAAAILPRRSPYLRSAMRLVDFARRPEIPVQLALDCIPRFDRLGICRQSHGALQIVFRSARKRFVLIPRLRHSLPSAMISSALTASMVAIAGAISLLL